MRLKQTKIVATLKSDKTGDKPENPLSLQSSAYRPLERILLNIIDPNILQAVPVEQVGLKEVQLSN